ncbi:MAG: carbon-nitrogen hydrolase family protein [Chitinophagaceae bacterium]|nr:carbon-nitrogen hydrolase family protein [Chitinophagaceae bacterium]
MTVKVAMAQMDVKGNDIETNLKSAERLVADAAKGGAQIVILPECMDIGWTHPGSLQNATTIPDGKVYTKLVELAKKNNIYICSGMTEKDGAKHYNTAVFINPKGELLLKHRKINELGIGKPYYAVGDRLNVVDTELGRFGVMICADALPWDRSITTALARMSPDIILSPCSWAVPPGFDNKVTPYGDLWRDAYMPVAGQFSTYILGVSNVGPIVDGPWKGWDCIGASLAVDNKGKEIVQCPFGVDAESITYVDCEF